MHKSQKIDRRPAYYDGQLLQAEDFVAEQQYHRWALRRHNMALHDWGVGSGLEVKVNANQVTVQPGFALDENGHEIDLAHAVTLDLAGFPSHVRLRVTLHYRTDDEPERENRNRIDSYAVVDVSDIVDDKGSLLLATLQLDAAGKVDPLSIDTSAVRRLSTRIAAGSVSVAALADDLKRAWVAMPFHAMPLEKGPDREKALPPPFRMGTTEARSHDRWDGVDNTHGAGGSMTIPIPFGARRVLRLRIAGVENQSGIDLHLVQGGFDAKSGQHMRKPLLEKSIKGHPYNETFEVGGKDGAPLPECTTLALWVRGHAKCSISVVALEFAIDASN